VHRVLERLLQLSKLPLENFGPWMFANSPTGRGYLEANVTPDPATTKPVIRVATTQLERPSPPAPMRCVERYAQAEHAVAALSSAENVVFGGDMCWHDGTDRPFPLPASWSAAWSAWKESCRGTISCCTYNVMWEEEVGTFNGFAAPSESVLRRSDRFVCELKDYSLSGMEIIGDSERDVVLRYTKFKRHYSGSGWPDSIPLGPSCHRGLLMTIAPKEPAVGSTPTGRRRRA